MNVFGEFFSLVIGGFYVLNNLIMGCCVIEFKGEEIIFVYLGLEEEVILKWFVKE